MPLLFSYGTLQQAEVQLATFGRLLQGAPDALVCSPGGFAGHVSGVQRYAYAPDENGAVTVCRLRKAPRKVWTEGAGENGAYGYVERPDFVGGGKRLTPGRTHHYDFNF